MTTILESYPGGNPLKYPDACPRAMVVKGDAAKEHGVDQLDLQCAENPGHSGDHRDVIFLNEAKTEYLLCTWSGMNLTVQKIGKK